MKVIMMQNITFTFPENTGSAQEFFKYLKEILAQAPNSQASPKGVSFAASAPQRALPVIRFYSDKHTNFPALRLDVDDKLDRLIEESLEKAHPKEILPAFLEDPAVSKTDKLGTYYDVTVNGRTGSCLGIQEIQKRLEGHIRRIDHFGVNLVSERLSRQQWDEFIYQTSLNCNLYKYPTGEDWPFILPATIEEFETEISFFPIGRDPKFEFVFDTFSSVPTFQFDIETDLNRTEVESLFPGPYGISFPGLADYFRTVYVHHEWGGLNIRFDIRFKSADPANSWNTGEWLVKKGGRINPKIAKKHS